MRGESRFPGSIIFLLIVNLIVYILTLFHPRLELLLGFWPRYIDERPWGVFTALFVHAGLGHLIANMISLYFLGIILVGFVGNKELFKVYFIAGLAGNFLFLLWWLFVTHPLHPFSNPMLVGASGAIFGVGGALAVIAPRLRVFAFPIPAPIPLWLAVIIGLIISSLHPYVAWQAHLGGFIAGSLMGLRLRRCLW